MKNYFQKNPVASVILIIVLLLIVGGIYSAIRHRATLPAQETDQGVNIVATSTSVVTSSTTPTISVSQPTFAFSVTTATSTYTQDEPIDITVSILNLSSTTQTLSFKNGCAGDYTIGTFDMIQHTVCLSNPTSVTIAPQQVRQVQLTHYPSVYVLPVGTYTLTGKIIGYGGASTQITITPSSASTMPIVSASSSPLVLSLTTDKTTYSQTDPIQMTLTAQNSSGGTITRAVGGCEPSYTIAAFNSLTAGPCPDIVYNQKIPAGTSYSWNITFNPAFPTNYRIPTGVQKLTVFLSNTESTSTYITIN